MSTSYPNLKDSKVIAMDIETYDPALIGSGPGVYRRDGNILGVSIANEDGFAEYYNLGHRGVTKEEKLKNVRYLREVLGFPCKKLGANILYDADWLENWANISVNGELHDVQKAEVLVDEHQYSYSLDTLATKYLGRGKFKSEIQEFCDTHNLKGDPRKHLYLMPYELVRNYAIEDVREPLEIFSKQWEIMKTQELLSAYHLEVKLNRLLLQMRKTGVRIDIPYVIEQTKELAAMIKDGERELFKEYGRFNYNSSKQVAEIFDKLNIEYRVTEKGNPSITADDLALIKHPIAEQIRLIKKITKARSTFFVNSFTEARVGDKIHSSFLSMKRDEGGTITGRFSSKSPNLQQIPAKDKLIGPMCRRAFIPEEGKLLFKIDWSQIEYRIIAHYASGPGSDQIREEYNNDPSTDYHQFVMNLTGLERKPAKNLNFGCAYSMGIKTCAQKFHWTLEESENYLKLYHSKVPFVKATSKQIVEVAKARGYIKTVTGRRTRISEQMVKDHKEFVKFNHLIQGTASDVMKLAMVQAHEEGIFEVLTPHLTVHDELVGSMPVTQEGINAYIRLKEIMETCVDLKVPILADAEIGLNWNDVVDFTGNLKDCEELLNEKTRK